MSMSYQSCLSCLGQQYTIISNGKAVVLQIGSYLQGCLPLTACTYLGAVPFAGQALLVESKDQGAHENSCVLTVVIMDFSLGK